MSRSDFDVVESYTGNGSTDTYTFDFKIEALEHLEVVEYDTDGVETERVRGDDTTYIDSVEFDATDGGGTVVLTDNLTSGYTLKLILANDEPTQDYEFKNKGDLTLSRLEAALDFLAGPIQRLMYLALRSSRLNDYDALGDFNPMFPPGMAGAVSLIPSTNADGNGWADVADWTPVTDLTAAIAAAEAAADSETAAAASATAAELSRISAVAAENNAEASDTAAAASAAAAAASASAASTSASSASTSASSASTSASSASTSASSASTSASSASTSASGASTSASAAAASAADALASANAAAMFAELPNLLNDYANPEQVSSAGNPVPFDGSNGYYDNVMYVRGLGGAQDLSSLNPQIEPGNAHGQRLQLIGTHDTNTVKLSTGNGINIEESIVLSDNRMIKLFWDHPRSLWLEEWRR